VYLRTYVRMCVCAYVRMCVRAYVRMCVCAYVRTCVCAYVRMCECAYVRPRWRFYSELKFMGGRNPRGFLAAGKPLFRSGCTLHWHSSKNLLTWGVSFPQPLPIAVCKRADVARAAESKCDKVGQIGR